MPYMSYVFDIDKENILDGFIASTTTLHCCLPLNR
jgi:hypothetical protein